MRPELAAETPKAAGSFDRSVPLAATRALIPALRKRFAITRIAELTYLDRAAVPVFSAVVPRSPDAISVYNGKGLTAEDALVGAVMEAVERQCAARPSPPRVTMRRSEGDCIDPRSVGVLPERCGERLEFVRGYDLFRERETFVPLCAVQFPWPKKGTQQHSTTNGLAAGNNLVEAAYHALIELLERHIVSLAHARGHVRPRLVIQRFCGLDPKQNPPAMIDDPVGRELELPCGDATIDAYLARVCSAGLELRVLVVEEAQLPLLAVATVAETSGRGNRAHLGLGCAWSPRHAVVRAITEAMQSRLADASAAREDFVRENDVRDAPFDCMRRRSRLPHGRWYFDVAHERVALCALPDFSDADLSRDVRLSIAALQAIGATRAALVDLTPPACPVRVVRAIVPDLETAFIDGRIGPTISALLADVRPRPSLA